MSLGLAKVYQPSTTALEETSPDGPVELETPYRQAIESKTLGIVRFAHQYHNLDLDGMMLDSRLSMPP